MLDLLPASSKRILVAPLNWGLGHASRSIPVIYKLLEAKKEVILASDGEALCLLIEEFPNLKALKLPEYGVKYNGSSLLHFIITNAFRVFKAIVAEKKAAQKLIKKNRIDTVVSDSRFGFRSDDAHSIIISHQLNLKVWNGILASVVHYINQYLVNKFDQCWIPDDPVVKLSGKLSDNVNIKNQKYIGVLSRLNPVDTPKKYDLAIILSGPESARTKLEKKLIDTLVKTNKKIILVRGTEKGPELKLTSNWTTIERANSMKINEIILSSEKVISRAGYSSIMDYYTLGKKATLIPTPGQAEQEYLSSYLNGKNGFECITEQDLFERLKSIRNE